MLWFFFCWKNQSWPWGGPWYEWKSFHNLKSLNTILLPQKHVFIQVDTQISVSVQFDTQICDAIRQLPRIKHESQLLPFEGEKWARVEPKLSLSAFEGEMKFWTFVREVFYFNYAWSISDNETTLCVQGIFVLWFCFIGPSRTSYVSNATRAIVEWGILYMYDDQHRLEKYKPAVLLSKKKKKNSVDNRESRGRSLSPPSKSLSFSLSFNLSLSL
jgi:hypothetical protein